jgi:hypothetical protein
MSDAREATGLRQENNPRLRRAGAQAKGGQR